jgi:hypothetical protein
MPDQNSPNTLPFAARDAGPDGTIPADALLLLAGCRDRLAHGVAKALAENLGAVADDLLGMADRATSLEQQQRYFAAMEVLTSRGQDFVERFRDGLCAHFDVGLAALRRDRPSDAPGNACDLHPVTADAFKRDLVLGKLAARAVCHCAEQLTALDRRLAALLASARIDEDDNPLYPHALFAAVLRAFDALGVAQPLALTILEAFERQTQAALPAIYAGLNRHLVDDGSAPALPNGSRRVPCGEPGDRLTGPAAGVLGQPGTGGLADQRPDAPALDPAAAGLAGLPAPARFEDLVFDQLARAIAAATRTPRGRRAAPPGSDPKPAPTLGLAQLMAVLTALQRGRSDPQHLPGLGTAALAAGPGTVLQQLRATALAAGSHPVDALTIDIVALLFDAIFADPDLPATLRAEVARLQIPVLKAALLDKAFFSNKRHPARRLLDLIASAGLGRHEADAPRLMTSIQAIVSEVVAGFETSIDIFAAQAQQLEDFLADEEARARTRTTVVVDKLAQRDRRDLAQARVTTEIGARLKVPGMPALIGEFLDRHWRSVLEQTYVRHGDEAQPWQQALAAMDDLLWSVAPKHGAAERNRLLTSLPDLLSRLRVPLEAAGLQEVWDPFFGQLIRLHMGALHKDSAGATYREPPNPEPVTAPPPPATAERPGLRAVDLVEAAHCIEYHPAAQGGAPTNSEPLADRELRLARSLELGTWVEFESFLGTRKTLRLSWISQLRGVYLFTNRQGENAMTLAPASLAEHLRKGTARVLNQAPLTERAVAHLLARTASAAATL